MTTLLFVIPFLFVIPQRSLFVIPQRSLFVIPRRSLFVIPQRSLFVIPQRSGGICFSPTHRVVSRPKPIPALRKILRPPKLPLVEPHLLGIPIRRLRVVQPIMGHNALEAVGMRQHPVTPPLSPPTTGCPSA